MVRHMKSRIASDWKAMLVIFIAGGAVVWHILACVESPMAFSPDGNRLAFVILEPYDQSDDDIALQGPRAYRLMVIEKERHLQVLETSTTHMLTGPGFSPDGKRLCYLRLPLLTKSQLEKMNDHTKHRDEATKSVGEFSWQFEGAASQPASEPIEISDQTLPPIAGTVELYQTSEALPPIPVTLVVRDVSTKVVVREIAVRVPMKPDKQYMFNYLLAKPQYSPDGGTAYFSLGGVVMSVNVQSGASRVLATSAYAASLSPDGKILAVLIGLEKELNLGLIQTDGSAASYYRWSKPASLSGLTWIDHKTFALLEPKPGKDQWVHMIRTDGTLRKSIPLHLNISSDSKPDLGVGELAMSSNGQHIVVAMGSDVYFLNSSGKIERHVNADKDKIKLAQPTFAPDSKKVAFKQAIEGSRPEAFNQIVFYTPQGKPITTVLIPPLPEGTTHPAE